MIKFADPSKGAVAEWLGNGLQNHVQRFESARHLETKDTPKKRVFSICHKHDNPFGVCEYNFAL